MSSGIYLIKNKLDGKIYVGSAVCLKKRLYAHRWHLNKNIHVNIHLQRAWNKYGESNFIFKEFLFCSKGDLISNEQKVMDEFKEKYGIKILYNINLVAGSTLGGKHSEETKRKIGAKSKGRWTGKKHSEETKRKIRLGNVGSNKGRIASAEARLKMSKSRKGKPHSKEHSKKISEALMGHSVSEETRQKLRLANKK